MQITSSEPFWLIKNGIINSYPSLQKNEHCDILIIGGGITGALTAHALVREGYDVILTDKRHVATGSTAATTSMLQYEIDTPLYKLIEMIGKDDAIASYKACNDAIDTLGKVSYELDSDCGFAYKDSLYIAQQEAHIPNLKKEFHARQEAGFNVEWVEQAIMEHRYGISAPAGILSHHGASVDAYRMAHDLLAYNARKGLRIYDHTHIIETRNELTHSICATVTGQSIRARYIVFCTGYETQKLLKKQVVSLLSTYACVSETNIPLQPAMDNTLVWDTGNPYYYMRCTDDGRLLIGGEDEPFKNPFLRDKIIGIKKEKLQEHVKTILPNAPFLPDFCWAGTFGATKDGLPYIGWHPEYRNCLFVLGFGGNGITFSASAMDIIPALLKNEKHPLTRIFGFGR